MGKKAVRPRPRPPEPAPPPDPPAPPLEPQNLGLPGSAARPTGPDESWRRIAAARAPAFDQSVPAYLLDANYWFLDWNPAFDELVARPLGLKRLRNHAEDFVAKLENVDSVYKRSKHVFDPENPPAIDTEPLALRTDRYGRVSFLKVAAQIIDERAQLVAWSVYLNVTGTERGDLWEDLRVRLERDLNWSRYAISYDLLLRDFDENAALLGLMVGKLAGARKVLDLGAGTGNGTLRLLRAPGGKEVWAVESNHAMVQQLVAKVERAGAEAGQDYFGRLHVLKEDIQRLDDVRDFLTAGSYDGALLVNVLYALDDPLKCLKDVFALLRSGGRLVLSTSHRDTDVGKLFARMRQVLEAKGLFEQLRPNFDDARRRHDAMDAAIHRDTKSSVRSYVEGAGFRIVDWRESEYVDAVVVVEAVKP
ncbi:class I SAM-dependent methyltransferase [Urbifossiella limnaea]|uniref:tRNA (Mo5U34)-methyltransferase n=1 Tax=Urbifossiella limnaea TaxID=2528023 RepID=A0A517Y2F2_9BACT|nr:class I SAM-dependent methyltransferase [Urbifossiella limnaea]QDU23878.1 tRNA (mo5U34)-methyltransferase [Urbifossiella limnaea]